MLKTAAQEFLDRGWERCARLVDFAQAFRRSAVPVSAQPALYRSHSSIWNRLGLPFGVGTSSLNARLLVAASVVLAAFLGLTGLVLDEAFRDSAEAALRDRLQGNIYALLAAADLDPDGRLRVRQNLPEARFSTPGSGFYAQIAGDGGGMVWRSPSMLGMTLPVKANIAEGERRYATLTLPDGTPLYSLSLGVVWEIGKSVTRAFTFSAAESLDGLNTQVRHFRASLWGWLGGLALVLLAVQGSILRWSLAPLRRVERDLAEIEAGNSTELSGEYPRELRGLTDNLNALIRHGRDHLERYRHTLDDLAHSLKTPLAVLRAAPPTETSRGELYRTVQDQVERMNGIVQHQLQRAATSGRATLAAPLPLARAARVVAESLDKIYADKAVKYSVLVDGAAFHGDECDLMELLGNLLDNAYKYCRSSVSLSAHNYDPTQVGMVIGGLSTPSMVPSAPHTPPLPRQGSGLFLCVEDDGPGIPIDLADQVLQRGVRADLAIPGHGIGLAVVQDIVAAYGGVLEMSAGSLGGARVAVRLPGQ